MSEGIADWNAETNLAGIPPAGARLDPDRTYKMKTVEVTQGLKKDGSGKTTYTFVMECTEPAYYAGRRLMKTMGDFADPESKGRGFWVTALMAHGVDRAQIEKGTIRISPQLFIGKESFVFVGPAKPPKGYSDQEFLLPEVGARNLVREKNLKPGEGVSGGDNAPATAAAPAADPFAA